MRARSWLWVAVLGFGIMVGAYATRSRPTAGSPFAHGFVFVGPEPSKDTRLTGRVLPARLRLLPGNDRALAMLKAMERVLPDKSKGLQWELSRKLIVLPLGEAGLGADSLQSGRLPEPGHDEALAGAGPATPDRVDVDGRTLNVVGVLKAEVSLPDDCLLVPSSESARGLVPPGDPIAYDAIVVGLAPEQFHDRELVRELEAAFPSPPYTMLTPRGLLGAGTFYLYLAGQGVLLLGGSGALIGLHSWLAGPLRRTWLAGPLQEMHLRPRLVWGVHLVYFGLMMAASVLIYHLPEVQALLLSNVRDQLSGSDGLLGIAGKAYASGSILRAAGVTFAINVVVGAIVSITVPSIIVPGSSALPSAFRAIMWGLLLAPTFVLNAFTMLPHSGTILLEGEGYILATFFGLLVPIYLFGPSPAPVPKSPVAPEFDAVPTEPAPPGPPATVLSRYGRAVLLNIQGGLLVAVILAVAAIWEATEVIFWRSL
jgi:hypothetical protein